MAGLYGQFSCDMPTELLKKGVGWQDRAVYAEAALFCRKELTDGVIDRVLLSMWMIDMPPKEREARLDRMVKLKALRRHKRGWCFPPHVWAEWGVMKADVLAKRAAEAQRKADYRAKLSHRDMNGTRPDVRVTATRPSKQPEPEPEPEPEPSFSLHQSPTSTVVARDTSQDDRDDTQGIQNVIATLAAGFRPVQGDNTPEPRRRTGGGIYNDVRRGA